MTSVLASSQQPFSLQTTQSPFLEYSQLPQIALLGVTGA